MAIMRRSKTATRIPEAAGQDLHHISTNHGVFTVHKASPKGTVDKIEKLGPLRIRITFSNLRTIIVYAADATEIW
jgi:hypothetical protein